jgi:membrane carboxypeptidase/penicillin-binding protein
MSRALRFAARGLVAGYKPWSIDFKRLVDQLRRTEVPALSEQFLSVLVAAEDRRYWSHCGVDVRGVARALVSSVIFGRLQGASTIQQQLVRVVTGRRERTLRRKLREIALAISLGCEFTQRRLLELYLTLGYYGSDMSGIASACQRLGVPLNTSNCGKIAGVVARLRHPQPRNPSLRYSIRIGDRTSYILSRMAFGREADPGSCQRVESNSAKAFTARPPQ